MSWQKSSSNFFIERKNDDWDTETEVPELEHIHNSTDSYNNMVEAKEWTKIDPKYADIISLTTHLYKLDKYKKSVLERV